MAPYFRIFKSSAINWCIGLIIKCLIHFSQTRNSWMRSSERIVNIFKQTHNLAQNGCGIILFPYIEYLETKWKLVYECQNIWFEFYQQWRVACPIMKSVQTYPKWTSNIQITNISSGWFRLKMRSMKPCLLS